MPYSFAAKNLMLGSLRLAITHASLHSGRPSKANEIQGGGYKRIPVEFQAPLNGALKLGAKPIFSVPAGAVVSHAAFWTAASGGVLLAHGQVKEEKYAKRGVYVIDAAKLDLNLESP